jgi:hypothetical protein
VIIILKNCVECGEQFTPNSSSQKCCCVGCSEARRKRKKRAIHKQYYRTHLKEIKLKNKEYNARSERKAKKREYDALPEVKDRRNKRYQEKSLLLREKERFLRNNPEELEKIRVKLMKEIRGE